MFDVRWADLLDIAIIAVLLYGLLLWLHDRAPRPMLAALLAIAALYGLARALNLYRTLSLFQAGVLLFVALVVVFQHDLRPAIDQGFSRGRDQNRMPSRPPLPRSWRPPAIRASPA